MMALRKIRTQYDGRVRVTIFGNAIGDSITDGFSGSRKPAGSAAASESEESTSTVEERRASIGNFITPIPDDQIQLTEFPTLDLAPPTFEIEPEAVAAPRGRVISSNRRSLNQDLIDQAVAAGIGTSPFNGAIEDAFDAKLYEALANPQNYPTLEERVAAARPNGEARGLSDFEVFTSFNPVGRVLSAFGRGTKALIRSPVTLVEGVANLASDAYGFGKDAIFGPEQSVLGFDLPYEAKSSLVQSVQQRGALVTGGSLVVGTIKSLPLLAQIDAVNRNDLDALGESLPGSLLALGGGALLSRGSGAFSASRTGQLTGVAEFDQPFAQSAQASAVLNALERRGVRVIDDASRLDASIGEAAFVKTIDGRLTVVYDSKTTSFIDFLHETRHVAQIQRAERAGVLGNIDPFANTKIRGLAERGAYEFELRVAERRGFSSEYKSYLQKSIERYYNPGFTSKFRASETYRKISEAIEPRVARRIQGRDQ